MDFSLGNDNMFDPQTNPLDNVQFDPSKNITIIFKRGDRSEKSGQSLVIQSNLDEKVSSIIKRYRNKTFSFERELQFIFNAMPLNPSLTVSEAGLKNNSQIVVVYTEKIIG